MRVLFLEEPIFHVSLMVLCDCSSKEALDYLQSKGVNTGNTQYTHGDGWYYKILDSMNKNKHEFSCMWLRRNNALSIAHEASHLVMQVFEDAGVPISNENGETFAYYLSYWISAVQKAMRK